MKLPEDKNLVLFDGYCHMCSRFVRTILRFDKKQHFLFAPLSGETGAYWIEKLHVPKEVDSVILVRHDEYLIKSEAILKIAKQLGGIFWFIRIFRIIPLKARDKFYDFVARNRFKWFGKRNSCMIPSEKQRKQFI